jgi:hypothetical protein
MLLGVAREPHAGCRAVIASEMSASRSASEVETILVEVLREAGAEGDATMLLAEALRFAAILEPPTASVDLRTFVRGPLRRTAANARGTAFAGRMAAAMVRRFGWGGTDVGLGGSAPPMPSAEPPKRVSMPPARGPREPAAITQDYVGSAVHRLDVVVFDHDPARGDALVAALALQRITAVVVTSVGLAQRVCEGMRPILFAMPTRAEGEAEAWRDGIDPAELALRHVAYSATETSAALRTIVDALGDDLL